MSDDVPAVPTTDTVATISEEIARNKSTKRRRITEKFLMAAIGAIPWIGGFIAAIASIKGDEAAVRGDDLRTQWLQEHTAKLHRLEADIAHINARFESVGESVDERIQDPKYLALVTEAFRAWDEAQTDEKREYARNLIVNAAGTRVCSDDVVRLFIQWIRQFHEMHFALIRELFNNPGSTRFDIWAGVYGEGLPREDSAEADLYKTIIRDLNMGGVLRQLRDVNEAGQFKRKRPVRRRGSAPAVMESAFEDSKPYVLTELGKQFVHYTMNDAVTRLGE